MSFGMIFPEIFNFLWINMKCLLRYKWETASENEFSNRESIIVEDISKMLINGFKINDMKMKLRQLNRSKV